MFRYEIGVCPVSYNFALSAICDSAKLHWRRLGVAYQTLRMSSPFGERGKTVTSEANLRATWTVDVLGKLLSRIEGFGRMPSAEALQLLINNGRFVSFARGGRITSRDDEAPSFLVVLSGRVRLFGGSADGREFLATLLGAGQIFGLRPCLDNQARSYNSAADQDTCVLLIPGPKLKVLLAQNSELMEIAIQFLCHRLGAVSQALEQFALWGPTQHLAWRIVDLLRAPYPDTSSQGEIKLDVSQDDLARMIGKTRQTTNKLLKDLERSGFISIDYGGLIVRDLQRLKAFVNSDA